MDENSEDKDDKTDKAQEFISKFPELHKKYPQMSSFYGLGLKDMMEILRLLSFHKAVDSADVGQAKKFAETFGGHAALKQINEGSVRSEVLNQMMSESKNINKSNIISKYTGRPRNERDKD